MRVRVEVGVRVGVRVRVRVRVSVTVRLTATVTITAKSSTLPGMNCAQSPPTATSKGTQLIVAWLGLG